MKLSKESLHEILFEASMSIYDDSYKAGVALETDTLEIEGYERAEWVKFDPHDESTFPACNSEWFLIAAQKSLKPPTFTMMAERATQTLLEEIRRDIIKFRLNVYWRPLPPPPGKEEVK